MSAKERLENMGWATAEHDCGVHRGMHETLLTAAKDERTAEALVLVDDALINLSKAPFLDVELNNMWQRVLEMVEAAEA